MRTFRKQNTQPLRAHTNAVDDATCTTGHRRALACLLRMLESRVKDFDERSDHLSLGATPVGCRAIVDGGRASRARAHCVRVCAQPVGVAIGGKGVRASIQRRWVVGRCQCAVCLNHRTNAVPGLGGGVAALNCHFKGVCVANFTRFRMFWALKAARFSACCASLAAIQRGRGSQRRFRLPPKMG